MTKNIIQVGENPRKKNVENANSEEVKDFTISNRFCYYWNPSDDRDNKDVILIEDNVEGYYTTDYPRMNKEQIMKMNHNIGLSDSEVYEICQCNCKIIFSNEPTGAREKMREERERRERQ